MSLSFVPDRNPLQDPMPNPCPEVNEPQQQETMTNRANKRPRVDAGSSSQLLSKAIGKCLYCLKMGHHYTAACPYAELVPKNTKLHPGCQIVCWICGCHFREGKWGCCGQEKARAILKHCVRCGQWADHWDTECPHKDQLDKVAQVAGTECATPKYRHSTYSCFLIGDHPEDAVRKFDEFLRKIDKDRYRRHLDKNAQLTPSSDLLAG